MRSRSSPIPGGGRGARSRRCRSVWDERGNGRVASADIVKPCAAASSQKFASRPRRRRRGGGLAGAARRVEADYAVPFLAHATMEPQTCTAQVRPGGVEVWAPSQDATTALATAAAAAGVSNDKVVVHRMMLGGGFGRRAAIQEYIREAVLIAKEVEAPVKLVWTREEDVKHDFYRPAGAARLTAGLDADGMPIAWKIRLAGPSFVSGIVPGFGNSFIDRSFLCGLTNEMPYDVPNYLVDYVVCQSPVPIGVWRAINYTQNVYYKECFVDEMAHAAGMDPYLYRRRLLRNSPKNLAVLDAAAKKADWFNAAAVRRIPRHRGQRGLRQLLRPVVEASVAGGAVRVHRVVSRSTPAMSSIRCRLRCRSKAPSCSH